MMTTFRYPPVHGSVLLCYTNQPIAGMLLFPDRHLSHGLCDGYSKRGVTVQDDNLNRAALPGDPESDPRNAVSAELSQTTDPPPDPSPVEDHQSTSAPGADPMSPTSDGIVRGTSSDDRITPKY